MWADEDYGDHAETQAKIRTSLSSLIQEAFGDSFELNSNLEIIHRENKKEKAGFIGKSQSGDYAEFNRKYTAQAVKYWELFQKYTKMTEGEARKPEIKLRSQAYFNSLGLPE